MTRRRVFLLSGIALAAAAFFWPSDGPHYLKADPAIFAASFDPPSDTNSAATRSELDELLQIQAERTEFEVTSAQADRKTRIERFYKAIGLDAANPPDLPEVEKLAARVEDDVRIHVRAVKERFRRSRPYVVEPRLQPCINDVADHLSYPSGHAAYAYSMGFLLEQMVPEKRDAIRARANEFARQRMVCGVHFRSDIEAGRVAALALAKEMNSSADFLEDLIDANEELRKELRLAPRPIITSRPAPRESVERVTRLLDARDQAFRDGDNVGVCRSTAKRFEYVERFFDNSLREPTSAQEFEAHQAAGRIDWHVVQTREQYCRAADRLSDLKFAAYRRRTDLTVTVTPGEDALRYQANYVLITPAPGAPRGDQYLYGRLRESGEVVEEDDQPRIRRATAILEQRRVTRNEISEADRRAVE